jgi:hypothetical protein
MPAIFSATSSEPYTVSFTGENQTDTPIRTIRKSMPDGHDIVIACNIDQAMNSARISMATWPSTHATVMFEQREVQVVNGSIVDTFEAMDTHVYRL